MNRQQFFTVWLGFYLIKIVFLLQALADKDQALADKDLTTVRNLILNTKLPDEQIALIASVSVSFVQECRADF
jgi:hypothetical protein